MSASIADIVNGVVDGSLGDEQVIDWLRSVFDNGLDEKSTITLTKLMRDSGQVLAWPPPRATTQRRDKVSPYHLPFAERSTCGG